MEDYIPQLFWSHEFVWIVVAAELPYGPKESYGPFNNHEVAYYWAEDMKFGSYKVMKLTPPIEPRTRNADLQS